MRKMINPQDIESLKIKFIEGKTNNEETLVVLRHLDSSPDELMIMNIAAGAYEAIKPVKKVCKHVQEESHSPKTVEDPTAGNRKAQFPVCFRIKPRNEGFPFFLSSTKDLAKRENHRKKMHFPISLINPDLFYGDFPLMPASVLPAVAMGGQWLMAGMLHAMAVIIDTLESFMADEVYGSLEHPVHTNEAAIASLPSPYDGKELEFAAFEELITEKTTSK